MNYEEIANDLRCIENLKTKDIDKYNKRLIKENIDVSDLKNYALTDQLVHRTYFQVSLGKLKNFKEQLEFIEENQDLLQDWWHTDQLNQFLKKPLDFDFTFDKAKIYIQSEKTFVRRWGYVLLLAGLQKNTEYTNDILSLIKDDDEYYVQMAQAWLICDLAVYNTNAVAKFIKSSKLKYNILGKAIQKICDSYRISAEDKEKFKAMRNNLKHN